MARDDFPPAVIEALGKRVGYFCSNPECGRPTVGPHTSPAKWVMLGVAAHITAAASGGKRYDSNLTPEKRKEISNGIWLCQICGKLIDSDELKYKKEVILKWKADKEAEIEANVTRGVVADVNGPPLAVSDRLMMGYIANVQIDDGSIAPVLTSRKRVSIPLAMPRHSPSGWLSARSRQYSRHLFLASAWR
jgi:hypothetical protein